MNNQQHDLRKFLLLLGILLSYFLFLSWKYDLKTGGIVSVLSWSFFVLCTPIADAGFLLDFPVRLIAGIRMVITEVMVWVIAIVSNLLTLQYSATSYEVTYLTRLLHQIISQPWPYWMVIVLSGIGTFLSIQLGDDVMDAFKQRQFSLLFKQAGGTFVFKLTAFLATLFVYFELLHRLGLSLPEV
jgi:hypothetical protein